MRAVALLGPDILCLWLFMEWALSSKQDTQFVHVLLASPPWFRKVIPFFSNGLQMPLKSDIPHTAP